MERQILLHDSPNFDDRPANAVIDSIVIHYTGMPTAAEALARLCDGSPEAQERGRVSCHYLIEEDGKIYSLVDDKNRAWHAGVSYWRGRTGLNDTSIGIELVNEGHDGNYKVFPRAQLDALVYLCKQLCEHHPIKQENIVAHSDIAPGRKIDPGEKFNWRYLAKNGIGIWPDPEPEDYARAQTYLSSSTALRNGLIRLGYNPALSIEVLSQAFNRHFSGNDTTNLTWESAASLVYLNRKIL